MVKKIVTVSAAQVKDIIHAIPNGEMFYIGFYRKSYICKNCKSKFPKADVCPDCGSDDIIINCEMNAQKGVCNPKNATKPGTGKFIGQSAEEAEAKNNNFKFYNSNGTDDKGRGIYRQCGFEKIYLLRSNGVEYKVFDAVK